MISSTPRSIDDFHEDAQDFSLVLGGPLFQLLRRAHLSDETATLVRKRVLIFVIITWLPLLVLAALEGHVWDGNVAVPFLQDLEAQSRFLVALPLLVIAELVVHQRMRHLVGQFLERKLIPKNAMVRFNAAIASAFRLRNSMLAEVLLIAFVYAVGISIIWRQNVALDTPTWYATPSADGSKLSVAGMWYGYVSLPIFQFLLLRWYFRFFIWARFLWQVSRINLRLVPTHPDRAGGLGFLTATVYAFVPLLIAHGALLAGLIGNRIFHVGARLLDYKYVILTFVLLLLCAVLGPLLVFATQLGAARRKGLREYGTLAETYVREFDAKWLRGGAPSDERLVGSADIQSLADLANSYEVVRTISFAPFSTRAIVQLAATILVPVAPLLLTIMPLDQILKILLGLVF
jgi:hypothetical protein